MHRRVHSSSEITARDHALPSHAQDAIHRRVRLLPSPRAPLGVAAQDALASALACANPPSLSGESKNTESHVNSFKISRATLPNNRPGNVKSNLRLNISFHALSPCRIRRSSSSSSRARQSAPDPPAIDATDDVRSQRQVRGRPRGVVSRAPNAARAPATTRREARRTPSPRGEACTTPSRRTREGRARRADAPAATGAGAARRRSRACEITDARPKEEIWARR